MRWRALWTAIRVVPSQHAGASYSLLSCGNRICAEYQASVVGFDVRDHLNVIDFAPLHAIAEDGYLCIATGGSDVDCLQHEPTAFIRRLIRPDRVFPPTVSHCSAPSQPHLPSLLWRRPSSSRAYFDTHAGTMDVRTSHLLRSDADQTIFRIWGTAPHTPTQGFFSRGVASREHCPAPPVEHRPHSVAECYRFLPRQ